MCFLKTCRVITLLGILVSSSAFADTAYYSGTMKILVTSGRACGTLAAKTYPVTMIVDRHPSGEISGFFEGEGLSLGKFSGRDAAFLPVTYPYHDQERSSGHSMALTENSPALSVTLHDRHVGADVDECNFDHAVMTLKLAADKRIETRRGALSKRYDAQLLRSEAIDLSRRGQLYDAVLRYEKALTLIDQVYPAGNSQWDSFSAALAGSYIKSGMTDEFNKLYAERFPLLKDEATRAVFTIYKVRTLQAAARIAMNREDFDAATAIYQRAFDLNPQDKQVIAGMMSAYMRSGRYDDAITFLVQAEKGLQSKEDRIDVRGATAMALLKQSITLDRSGKTPEAERSLKRAMEFDPESVLYSVALARLRHKTGKLADAEKILDQAEARFKDVTSRAVIGLGREKMRQVDAILKKINGAGS